MPRFDDAAFSNQDLTELLEWLHSQPRPVSGAELYSVFCGNCHGTVEQPGWVDENIRGESLGEFFSTVRSGEGDRDYGDHHEYMPAWNQAQLSEAEIRLIWSAVTGREDPGGDLDPSSDEGSGSSSDDSSGGSGSN